MNREFTWLLWMESWWCSRCIWNSFIPRYKAQELAEFRPQRKWNTFTVKLKYREQYRIMERLMKSAIITAQYTKLRKRTEVLAFINHIVCVWCYARYLYILLLFVTALKAAISDSVKTAVREAKTLTMLSQQVGKDWLGLVIVFSNMFLPITLCP